VRRGRLTAQCGQMACDALRTSTLQRGTPPPHLRQLFCVVAHGLWAEITTADHVLPINPPLFPQIARVSSLEYGASKSSSHTRIFRFVSFASIVPSRILRIGASRNTSDVPLRSDALLPAESSCPVQRCPEMSIHSLIDAGKLLLESLFQMCPMDVVDS
jgi:hypothetical protein